MNIVKSLFEYCDVFKERKVKLASTILKERGFTWWQHMQIDNLEFGRYNGKIRVSEEKGKKVRGPILAF